MHVDSTFKTCFPVNNCHAETIVPYFFRKVPSLKFSRERIETADHDFLDLDWTLSGNKKLVIISHGLEGSSNSNYISSLGNYLQDQNYDLLAWNYRGCSGETNRLPCMYHSGASHDLRAVVNHVLKTKSYESIDLVGFSMGGNITLKYLGEEGEGLNPTIKKALSVSTPVSLADCAEALSTGVSLIYSKHFIERIIKKLKIKQEHLPEFKPNFTYLKKLWKFEAFDNEITAPINGFIDAKDYWQKSSSLFYLKKIPIKTLIVNALNDPFLAKRCYPFAETKNHAFVDLETPSRGGQVGFLEQGFNKVWIDRRIGEFLET